ncbi:MAG TPA: integrase, partial [Anaerolineales bacterium]|nr:integrase [Anaerolineales bacterium]
MENLFDTMPSVISTVPQRPRSISSVAAAAVSSNTATLVTASAADTTTSTATTNPQTSVSSSCPTERLFLAALSVQPMDLLGPLRAPALPSTAKDWAAAQLADPSLAPIIRYLKSGELPACNSDANTAEYGRILKQSEQLLLGHEDVVWFNAAGQPRGFTRELLPGAVGLLRLVVPQSLQEAILVLYHDDPIHGGHRSTAESYSRLSEKFFWVGCHAAMRKYIAECMDCTQLRRGAPVDRPKSIPTPMPNKPYEVIYIDYLHVAKSNKGNSELLVIVDSFSGDVELIPTAAATAEAAVDAILLNVLARRLKLPIFINDQGSHFTAVELQLVIKSLNGESRFTSGYNPRSTGKVERMNRCVLKLLRTLVHNLPECWDEPQIMASILMNI